jgi:tripeptide aminopeptidase
VIDRARVLDGFLDLVRLGSVSRREGRVAKRLAALLEGLGASVEVDGAADPVGGDSGNLLARVPGTVPGVPAFLLSARMDTVVPGDDVRPVVEGDIVRTDGTTVLGGDDKAGIIAILAALRVLRERGIPHGPIEVLFSRGRPGARLGVSPAYTARGETVHDGPAPAPSSQ